MYTQAVWRGQAVGLVRPALLGKGAGSHAISNNEPAPLQLMAMPLMPRGNLGYSV